MTNDELMQLKALAETAKSEVIRSDGWEGTVEMGDHMLIDEDFIKAASPEAILALIAKVESLAADAERYQWLRNKTAESQATYVGSIFMAHNKDGLDKAIDIAMAKEKA